ncbi:MULTISPECIES: flagellar hook-length control protein FliK [unclassified Clostridium]|uniref:flagellar hook-length control protein FliK n=1 Tax=unclassified Clostridium TaxID=2614128 RepID=UPI0015FA3C6C|nr:MULTISPECIES: flagellar hook-length control protein FliK [unclassified Clostridium]
MTVPGVQSALSVKNAGVEMLAKSDKTQAVSGSDQFGAVMQQSMTKQSADKSSKAVVKDAGDDAGYKVPVVGDGQNVKVAQSQNSQLNDTGNANISGELVEDIVKDVLKLDDDQMDAILAAMGITVLQLLDPQILQQFVLTAEGAGDITDMLTSEMMLADYQMILQQFAQMPEGVSEILAQMEPVSEDDANLQGILQELTAVKPEQAPVVSDGEVLQKAVNTQEPAILGQTPSSDSSKTMSGESNASSTESFVQTSQPQTDASVEAVPFAQQFDLQGAREVQDAPMPNQSVQIIEQIVRQIRVSVTDTTSTMEMQLNPERLGKVLLTISAKEGMMTANFTVQTEEARLALESQMYQLRDTLEQKEIKVEAVSISVSDFSFAQGGGDDADSKNLEQGDGKSRRFQFEDSEEEAQEASDKEAERVRKSVMRDHGGSVDFTA